MRVLLTGGTGFLGSWVLERLLADRHQVAVLVRPGNDPWRIRGLLPSCTALAGEMAALPDLARFGPQAVLHLAWSGVSNQARNDPGQGGNVGHTLALVEAAAKAGAKSFLGLGSQAEYGPCGHAIDEDTPCRPTTLYGEAKLAAARAAEARCRELGLRFAWLRVFSAYGPRDHDYWMIPSLIRALLKRQRPALTAGEQMWDYLWSGDTAEAVVAVMTAGAEGVFNLGSGKAVPLRVVIEEIRDRIDPSLPLGFGDIPYRPDQVMRLEADISRLRRATGWGPRMSLQEGLARTVEWYRHDHP